MTSLDLAISKASHELGLSSEFVRKVYRTYWLAIKLVVLSLPLKGGLTEEQLSTLRASFNVPSLGKLYSSYDRVNGVKRRFNYLQQIKNNDLNKETKADVH